MSKKRVICIVGPTGTGKSALALRLASSFGGVVINADSRQVFRDFPIITAQPTRKEQALCPHHLYGFLATDERISAGAWAQRALLEIERSDFPILVGGTGLYLRALFDGMVDIPPLPDELTERLTQQCLASGSPALHRRLSGIDPLYAARIHPNDRQRIIRALAVFEATGKTFSQWHKQTPPPRSDMDIIRIGFRLPLAELEPLLATRIDRMLADGALEEAREALQQYPNADVPGWSGIGCIELYQHLSGFLSLADAKALWIRNTRAYAKRQLTWFNADNRIFWFSPNQSDEACEMLGLPPQTPPEGGDPPQTPSVRRSFP